MKNTLRSKTLTASLEASVAQIYSRIADPDQLAQWHTAFCRSLRKENGACMVESPRGLVPVRFLRDDRAGILDLVMTLLETIEFQTAIRVLANGTGSEVLMTLIQPAGLPDAAFHEQVRWAESALRNLRKTEIPVTATSAKPTERVEIPLTTKPTEDSAETAPTLSGQKLFVGNLPFDWSEELLRAHCADLGTIVNITIARFRNHGRSRGFGFVEMSTEAEAQAAIAKLHESLAGGRKIIVRIAHTKDSRPEKTSEASQPVATSEAITPAKEIPTPRPVQTRRPRDVQRPPALARRSRSTLPRSPRPSQDIQNKSGYEYFARRAPGTPAPVENQDSRPAPRREPTREASPYFDDATDVQQPPRRRGR
jgi:cold-inducible RNA-binding protein